jgi:hypothetical protein
MKTTVIAGRNGREQQRIGTLRSTSLASPQTDLSSSDMPQCMLPLYANR